MTHARPSTSLQPAIVHPSGDTFTNDHNSSEALPQSEDFPTDTDVSAILTAELALLDMLARLITEAVESHALPHEANYP